MRIGYRFAKRYAPSATLNRWGWRANSHTATRFATASEAGRVGIAKGSRRQPGIQLYGGVSGEADAAVEAFLAGKLAYNPDVHCDHHDHGHGEHHCGENKHGCAGHGGCHG